MSGYLDKFRTLFHTQIPHIDCEMQATIEKHFSPQLLNINYYFIRHNVNIIIKRYLNKRSQIYRLQIANRTAAAQQI